MNKDKLIEILDSIKKNIKKKVLISFAMLI